MFASKQEKWSSERHHFDRIASQRRETPEKIEEATLNVYRRPGSLFSKQWGLKQLGSLEGKKVLEIGCGEGENCALLALLGAEVTGIDISPKSIQNAELRCKINGVSDRVDFICSPIETSKVGEKYDIITITAFLHHILDDLNFCMDRVTQLLKPEGMLLIEEPTCPLPFVRRIRGLIPIAPDAATPDERPLNRSEIELVKSYFSKVTVKEFGLTSRLSRFILRGDYLEHTAKWKSFLVHSLAKLDGILLKTRLFRDLASVQVLHGTVN